MSINNPLLRTFFLFMFVMAVVSCKQNKNDNPAGADGFDITIESEGDFVDLTQSQLTHSFEDGAAFAGRAAGADVKGLLAVQIYVAPRGGTADGDYKPYAHGLFEDWSSLAFKGNAQSRYKIVASLVADAQQWLEVKSDVYGLPFGAKVTVGGVVYSTKPGFSGLEAGEACFKDGTSYKTPSLDRYYGELTDIVADSKTTVSLFLNRTVFGMAYDITGLSSGKVIATIGGAPAYIITPITGKQTVVYSMSDVKNAWKLSNEEVKHSEIKNLTLVHVDEQGSSKELYNADVKLTCKTVTTVRATMGDKLDIATDDSPMAPGEGIVLGSGDGDDALQGAATVYLNSQKDVETLGALKLKKLTGCLTIDNFRGDITSLEPLSSIESIEDVLNIVNYKASGFRGLHNLKHLGSLQMDYVEASDYSAFSQIRNLNALQLSNTKGFLGLNIVSAVSINITKENGDVVINFPKLRYAGSLSITYCDMLREVRCGALESAGKIDFSYLPAIKIADLPKLERVSGDFNASSCHGLTSLNLSSLTSVGSSFSISSCDILSSLNLAGLTSVGGSFGVSSCDILSSLNLAGLTSVGSSFSISSCDILSSLNLAGLTSVGGSFGVSSCSGLHSLDISGLTNINGNFGIYGCNGLSSINLAGLTNVNGQFKVSRCSGLSSIDMSGFASVGMLDISDCQVLGSLSMPMLTSIGAEFSVSGCAGLNSINLAGLITLEGYFDISNCSGLRSINMAGLTSTCMRFRISSCDILSSIDVSGLTGAGGSFEVTSCSGLSSLSMPRLANIGEDFYVSECDKLSSINMAALISVEDGITISSCSDLSSISMPELTTVGGDFHIPGCSGLSSLNMAKLNSIGGSFNVNNCSKLSSLNMMGLTNVSEYFKIAGCDMLSSINMAGLTNVSNGFDISYCDKLIALPVLSSSLRIFGEVRINSNDLITNLDGLANVEYLGRVVFIHDNSKLVDFCAMKKHIKDPARTWSISYNGYNPTLDQIGGSGCSKPI